MHPTPDNFLGSFKSGLPDMATVRASGRGPAITTVSESVQ